MLSVSSPLLGYHGLRCSHSNDASGTPLKLKGDEKVNAKGGKQGTGSTPGRRGGPKSFVSSGHRGASLRARVEECGEGCKSAKLLKRTLRKSL